MKILFLVVGVIVVLGVLGKIIEVCENLFKKFSRWVVEETTWVEDTNSENKNRQLANPISSKSVEQRKNVTPNQSSRSDSETPAAARIRKAKEARREAERLKEEAERLERERVAREEAERRRVEMMHKEVRKKADGYKWNAVQNRDGVQLWEGGPYWATCNVGATVPEEWGLFFGGEMLMDATGSVFVRGRQECRTSVSLDFGRCRHRIWTVKV